MTVVEPRSWIARTGQRSKAIVTLAIACFAPAAAVLAFAFGAAAFATYPVWLWLGWDRGRRRR